MTDSPPPLGRDVLLPTAAAEHIREVLPVVAEECITAIVEEVPSYADAFAGPMGEKIRTAVEVALGGFLSLASRRPGHDLRTPAASALEGAYALGQGEARSGRSTESLLAAYRIGARVSWREMAGRGVAAGLDAGTLVAFAELVFAYIDELSAASVAGHNDELASTGRVLQRRLERLAQLLVAGAPPDTVQAAADRADWPVPATLTAVVLAQAHVRPVLAELGGRPLQVTDPAGLEDGGLLLVPDVHGRDRERLLRVVTPRGATVGPPRPWLAVGASYDRALRARARGVVGDTETRLTELVLTADPEALADLRARALAPLDGMRAATVEKLAETLRAWLLLQGRREEVATALFVHPQTVRYRMGQLREAYGDALDDPDRVLELVVALGAPGTSVALSP